MKSLQISWRKFILMSNDMATSYWQPNTVHTITATTANSDWMAEYYRVTNTNDINVVPSKPAPVTLNYKLSFNWSRPELAVAKEFWVKNVELQYHLNNHNFTLIFELPQIINLWKLDQPGSTIKLEYATDTGTEVLVPESLFACWSLKSDKNFTSIWLDTKGVVIPE